MHNPPHPGEVISGLYLDESNISARSFAEQIGVSASALNRVLNAKSAVTANMALRLGKALGTSPEMWMNMQQAYDLWHAKNEVPLNDIRQIDFQAA